MIRVRYFFFCLLCLVVSQTHAGMTATDAFNDGTDFGKTELGTAKGKIDTPAATAVVPDYTATDPASSYYAGGMGSLTAPASMGVTACTAMPGTSDPDPHTHGRCESTRMLMMDPGKKDVMFPLNKKTDPLAVKRDIVKGDPDTYLGSLIVTGAYSGCADKTIKDADKYETATCNQYLAVGQETCNEILSVTIVVRDFCTIGALEFPYSFSTTDRGGEYWIIRSICDGGADGRIQVSCSSGGGQTNSFLVSKTTSSVTPVLGTTCLPHTKYPSLYHEFYYSHTSCDPDTNECQVTMYDVNAWSRYAYSCEAGILDGVTCYESSICDSDGSCIPNKIGPATRTLNVNRSWIQKFRYLQSGFAEVDAWDDQCAPFRARLP